jgi:hypothetical protein
MVQETSPAVTGIRWWVWVLCLGGIALAIFPGATMAALLLLGPTALWTAGGIAVVVIAFRKSKSR